MKILTVIGARPQFIKSAVVSRILHDTKSVQEIIVHTGQHYDHNMSDVFFSELKIPEPHYNLCVGSGSHAYQTGMILQKIESVLEKEKPDWTLVYGDTNSTLAGSLAAAKLHIRVAHVEAGLRSFNRIMPEEINRIITDRLSDMLFAPTLTAMNNLGIEGLSSVSFFTGDVMYDSILFYKNLLLQDPDKFRMKGIPATYYLLTVHRAENTDNIVNLKLIFDAISKLQIPVVFPVHPRTRKAISTQISIPANLLLIVPVGYLQMIGLLLGSKKVLTDSGGLQKEAYFLGKQCITLRGETEWIETLHDNWNIITGTDPGKILKAINQPFPSVDTKNEFGKGNAAELIVSKLISSPTE
jgi:UDP-GlcNAc3NAcA epimerase